jgi:predicted dehydrogenase
MRKLQVGMVGGGGPGAFFGKVHLRAISLDGTRELVAGVLRSDKDASRVAADEWGIAGFPDCDAMIEAWQGGGIDLDYVTIVTPNNAHFAPAMACIEAGIPVLCEKPMTLNVGEAEQLAQLVRERSVPFVLAHTYTGHPMMMLAREMVKAGDIGEVRKIEAWYNQGWLNTALEGRGHQQASWRTNPAKAGISCCGGDIGTHAFVAATWVTGLGVSRVSARLNTFVQGRKLDDDFNVIAMMNNGATAVITATQIATGYKNDNGFRIFGTKGSLEWHQERAECLLVKYGDHDKVLWLGQAKLPPCVGSYTRAPAGHHEDFFEALANLHCTMERRVRAQDGESVPDPYDHPGVEEGLAGMNFVEAAVRSSAEDGAWIDV